MAVYQIGSHGDEVKQIQQALQAKELYRGPIDGAFGGGTRAAVIAFQRAQNLSVDGRVGNQTWGALFGTSVQAPTPQMFSEDLAKRCLALTGAFETGTGAPDCFCGISGDFDGQGIS